MVPWIFNSSNKLSIKSILISNFTWIEIYKEYLREDLWEKYIECYNKAYKVLLYPMYNKEMLDYFTLKNEIGISCRRFNEEKVINIKNRYDKPIVFVSVGRSLEIQKELDVNKLHFQFIVTEGIKLVGNNVEYLPINIENTQDYIKASEFIITKAGWVTCAEAILARKPMLLINRDNIAEDRNTTLILKELGIGKKIDFENIDIKSLMEFYETIETYQIAYNNLPDVFKYDVKKTVNKIMDEV